VRSSRLIAIILLFIPAFVSAQGSAPSWTWTLDQPARRSNAGRFTPADSVWEFASMAPGWHVTMGPGGYLYDPANVASGRYAVEAEMILFPGSSNEEFGVFVGGDHLADANATSTAFLIRRDGQWSVRARRNGQITVVSDWRAHEAVKPLTADGMIRNQVRVLAEPDSVRLFVNAVRVGAWERRMVAVDGVFGFRVGRGTNMHITNLDHTRRLAPFPAPRPTP
jgi:hypothetical protein